MTTWLARDDRRACCAYRGSAEAPSSWRLSPWCVLEEAPGLRHADGPVLSVGNTLLDVSLTFESGDAALTPLSRERLDPLAERYKEVDAKQGIGALQIVVSSGSELEGPPKGLGQKRAENIRSYLAQRGVFGVQARAAPGPKEHASSVWVGTSWSDISPPAEMRCASGVTLQAVIPRVHEIMRVEVCRNHECSIGFVQTSAKSPELASILFRLDGPLEALGLLTFEGRVGIHSAPPTDPVPAVGGERFLIEVRTAFRRHDLDDHDRYEWTVSAGRPLAQYQGPVLMTSRSGHRDGEICRNALLRVQ